MNDVWDWDVKESVEVVGVNSEVLGDPAVNQFDPNMVSIIVPIYNHSYPLWHYTGHCIGSVREHTDKDITPYELIVVDNGSPIKPGALSDYKADKVIVNGQNMGVAHAWNQAIRASRGGYICLLNNDTMVFDHWMEDLQECLKLRDFVMATPMYGDSYARATESAVIRDKWTDKPLEESFSDFRDFSCVICKKDLFDNIGIFDEQFGLGYGEDLDLFKRMDLAGKRYVSTKKVAIFHIIGATSSGIPEIPKMMDENRDKLKKKYEQQA
jgi:GT2 family glycosyltransferase